MSAEEIEEIIEHFEDAFDSGRFDEVLKFLANIESAEIRDKVLGLLAKRLASVGRCRDAIELLKQISSENLRDSIASTLNDMFLENDIIDCSMLLLHEPSISWIYRGFIARDIARKLASSQKCLEAYSLVAEIESKDDRDEGLVFVARCYAENKLFDKALEVVKHIINPLYSAYALLEVAYRICKHSAKGYEDLVEEAVNQLSRYEEYAAKHIDDDELGAVLAWHYYLESLAIFSPIVEHLAFLGREDLASDLSRRLCLGTILCYIEDIVAGLARRGDLQRALEIINEHLSSKDRRSYRVKAYERILTALAEEQKIGEIRDVVGRLDQKTYDQVIPVAMISYVENGGETPVALELLEKTKRIDSLLEGLIGIAIVLADQKRYKELDVVYKQLVSYLGKLGKPILDEEELPLRSLIIKLIDRLTRIKQYIRALQVIEIVKSIDEALATSLVNKLTRVSLALNDLPSLINALKRYSHVVDDIIAVIIGNIAFKYVENKSSPEEMIREINKIAEDIKACIDSKAKHLSRIEALSKCLEEFKHG